MQVGSSIYQWPGIARANPIASADISSGSNSTAGTAAPVSMSPAQAAVAQALATYVPGMYGNAQVITPNFAVAGDQLILPRPATGTRTFLLIVNNLAASVVNVNFDNVASAAIGIQIQPGGNLFMDQFVPQNDVHIFLPIAGVVTVAFCVIDPTNPTAMLQANS